MTSAQDIKDYLTKQMEEIGHARVLMGIFMFELDISHKQAIKLYNIFMKDKNASSFISETLLNNVRNI